jgi:hypothetical protein
VLHYYLDPDEAELGVHVTSKPYEDLDGALAGARLWLQTQRALTRRQQAAPGSDVEGGGDGRVVCRRGRGGPG